MSNNVVIMSDHGSDATDKFLENLNPLLAETQRIIQYSTEIKNDSQDVSHLDNLYWTESTPRIYSRVASCNSNASSSASTKFHKQHMYAPLSPTTLLASKSNNSRQQFAIMQPPQSRPPTVPSQTSAQSYVTGGIDSVLACGPADSKKHQFHSQNQGMVNYQHLLESMKVRRHSSSERAASVSSMTSGGTAISMETIQRIRQKFNQRFATANDDDETSAGVRNSSMLTNQELDVTNPILTSTGRLEADGSNPPPHPPPARLPYGWLTSDAVGSTRPLTATSTTASVATHYLSQVQSQMKLAEDARTEVERKARETLEAQLALLKQQDAEKQRELTALRRDGGEQRKLMEQMDERLGQLVEHWQKKELRQEKEVQLVERRLFEAEELVRQLQAALESSEKAREKEKMQVQQKVESLSGMLQCASLDQQKLEQQLSKLGNEAKHATNEALAANAAKEEMARVVEHVRLEAAAKAEQAVEQLRSLHMQIETLHRERDQIKTEYSLKVSHLEKQQRRIEEDWQARAEAVEQKHKEQIALMNARQHQHRDTEVLNIEQAHKREMQQREEEWTNRLRLVQEEYERAELRCRDLREQKRSIEAQKLEMLSRMQNVMQVHCDTALHVIMQQQQDQQRKQPVLKLPASPACLSTFDNSTDALASVEPLDYMLEQRVTSNSDSIKNSYFLHHHQLDDHQRNVFDDAACSEYEDEDDESQQESTVDAAAATLDDSVEMQLAIAADNRENSAFQYVESVSDVGNGSSCVSSNSFDQRDINRLSAAAVSNHKLVPPRQIAGYRKSRRTKANSLASAYFPHTSQSKLQIGGAPQKKQTSLVERASAVSLSPRQIRTYPQASPMSYQNGSDSNNYEMQFDHEKQNDLLNSMIPCSSSRRHRTAGTSAGSCFWRA